MESLIITEKKEEFPDFFVNNPVNLFITNSQAPLLLPCLQKQSFGSITVHNSILLGEKKIVTMLYSILKDEGSFKVVTVGGAHPEAMVGYM